MSFFLDLESDLLAPCWKSRSILSRDSLDECREEFLDEVFDEGGCLG